MICEARKLYIYENVKENNISEKPRNNDEMSLTEGSKSETERWVHRERQRENENERCIYINIHTEKKGVSVKEYNYLLLCAINICYMI